MIDFHSLWFKVWVWKVAKTHDAMVNKSFQGSFKVHFIIQNDKSLSLRSPLKDIVVGKNQSEWKKFRVWGKNIFQMFCVLSQNFCVPSRNFAFSRKTFAFPRETLRSLAKLLRSLAKIFAFPRKTFAFSRKYFFFLSFARERKYLCERTQKFCERTQKFCERTQSFSRERKSFARERKSFARERKTFEKYFFLPPWIFFHSPRFFPTTMSLKGLRISLY